MNAELEKSCGKAIETSSRKLRRALSRETLVALAVYAAASELLVDTLQPQDAGKLRMATVQLAMQRLGLTDKFIDSAKAQLVNAYERLPSVRSN